MSNPTHASAPPGSAALSSFAGRAVREPPGERSRRVVRASRDRELAAPGCVVVVEVGSGDAGGE